LPGGSIVTGSPRRAAFVASIVSSFGARGSNGSAFSLAILTILSAAVARCLERGMRDPDNLPLAVAHCVEPLAPAGELAVRRLARATRLAETDVAVQLAHDQDVEPAHFLGL
jgi:hypothetical protein